MNTTLRRTLAHQCRLPPTSDSKKPFRQPHLCLQLQETSQAAMILGGGGGQWGGKVGRKDPKKCGHPWHVMSQDPLQGGGISAAGDGDAAIKGALPGVGASSGAGELRLLPVVRGSPPGQGGHPHQACQHLPAMGVGKGRMQPQVREHRGPAHCPAHPGAGTKPSQSPRAPTFGPGKPGCPGLPTSPCKERGIRDIPTGCLQASYIDGARSRLEGFLTFIPGSPGTPCKQQGDHEHWMMAGDMMVGNIPGSAGWRGGKGQEWPYLWSFRSRWSRGEWQPRPLHVTLNAGRRG